MPAMNAVSDVCASFSFHLGQVTPENAATHSAVTKVRDYFKNRAASEICIVENEQVEHARYCLTLLVRLKDPSPLASIQKWFHRFTSKGPGSHLDQPFSFVSACNAEQSLALDRMHPGCSPSYRSADLCVTHAPDNRVTFNLKNLDEIQRSMGRIAQQGSAHCSNPQGSNSGGKTILESKEANKDTVDTSTTKTPADRGLHSANRITFSLVSIRPGDIEKSAQIFQNELVQQVRLRTKECTIDALKVPSQFGACIVLKVSIECVWKNPMHDYAIRRFLCSAIKCQLPGSRFRLDHGIKLQALSLEAVRRYYLSPPIQGSDRWLQYSLLCSEAHEMPLTELGEKLRNTVKTQEENLLKCKSKEDFKQTAIEKQVLLHSIAEVLGEVARSIAASAAAPNEELEVGRNSSARPRPDGAAPWPKAMDRGEKRITDTSFISATARLTFLL